MGRPRCARSPRTAPRSSSSSEQRSEACTSVPQKAFHYIQTVASATGTRQPVAFCRNIKRSTAHWLLVPGADAAKSCRCSRCRGVRALVMYLALCYLRAFMGLLSEVQFWADEFHTSQFSGTGTARRSTCIQRWYAWSDRARRVALGAGRRSPDHAPARPLGFAAPSRPGSPHRTVPGDHPARRRRLAPLRWASER
jgi:hypothetical protein